MRVWKAHMEFRSVLISLPYCFLREALSLGSELTNSARLASQWALRSACFLPQPWDCTPGHHGFLHRCWESNVGPHAYTASFLPTPQVLALDLNSLIQSSILNLIAGNTSLVEKKGKTTTTKKHLKSVYAWHGRKETQHQCNSIHFHNWWGGIISIQFSSSVSHSPCLLLLVKHLAEGSLAW